MFRHPFRSMVFCALALCVSFVLTQPGWAVTPQQMKAATAQKSGDRDTAGNEAHLPAQLSSDQVDSYLATLSDKEVRQLLAQKLKQETAGDQTSMAERETPDVERERGLDSFFYRLQRETAAALDRIAFALAGKTVGERGWAVALDRMSYGKGTGYLFFLLFIGFVLIGCGLLVERLLLRFSEDLRKQLLNTVALGKLQKLGRFISRLLLDALGVTAYILTTFILFVLFYKRGEAGFGIVSALIISSYYVRIIMFAAKVTLAPAAPRLRVLPLQDRDAKFLYRWIIGISLVAALFAAPAAMFLHVGKNEELFLLFFSAAGVSVTLFLIGMVWQSRQRVAEAICPDLSGGTDAAQSLRAKFARTWHFFAILYLLGTGSFWLISVLSGGGVRIIKLIASLFLIPLFIGLDQWGRRLLKIASGELPETVDLSGDEEPETADELPIDTDRKMYVQQYVPLIKGAFRAVLVALLFFLVLRFWGIDLQIGRFFTSHVLEIIVTLMLGFFLWEFTKARIDRKIREEMPEQDEEAEEGGAGGSRSVTLLLLLRKFLLATMFVIVSLIVLSSIGVNIGPLIAGAGVVGLAIGFGAQTLVKDIISGVFFLIDDAFRVGDYVEAAGTKGTVEQISLRSLKLRHPRGMVYTIPFGDMTSVQNFSRDYIITKLEIRVRYDTDVDKVRKIIKKINETFVKDEEMGPVLLGKIKSQGVKAMDDSAMVMRVKFKTIPGQQFIVRREVYRRIQEDFRANGIEFAHRNVTVYLPPEPAAPESTVEQNKTVPPADTSEAKLLQAGAAAAAAIAAEQEEQAAKEPEK
ncbi:MAG: mechanosensitive ion channel family protein [Deltaproteobacteria bacterium]|nr:MAG: mechanosensitive ion channel family protein [Deltaproteobacteria bacterium]